MQRKVEQHAPQLMPAPRPVHGCPVCWEKQKPGGEYARGWMSSIPVYLQDGQQFTPVCYVAKCHVCGYVGHYGLQQGVYKLNGRVPDFAIRLWPEISRRRINPDKFLDKVLRAGKGPVYVNVSEVRG